MAGLRSWIRGWFAEKGEPPPATSLKHSLPEPEGLRSFADGHNDFSVALYDRLRLQPGNLFFSPFSLRTVLAMAYAGARGETAGQMRLALRLPPSDLTLHARFGEVVRYLAAGDQCEMSVANALWAQEGAPLQADFRQVVDRHYAGALHFADFLEHAEFARVSINRWVEDQTRRRIRELIPSGGLDEDTRLVLANAIYFKGVWVLPFRKALTRDEPFHLDGGGTVQAPLMCRPDEVWYLKEVGFQAVDLLYRGDALSMLLLLPDRRDGLKDLETRLSAPMLHSCVTRMHLRDVKLFLPRFRLTWAAELGNPLGALGMPLVFTRQADFSGINGRLPPHLESLLVSAVFHKAFVQVHEEGTEAAAASAAGVVLGAAHMPPPVPIFRADHPFLFAILHRRSGAILFLGRLVDPTREG